jgi:HSP20 family molecular chaperone IbpA
MSTLLQRVEGFMADGRYIVRAELSGFDLEKDMEVTVGPGYLTIKAEQAEKSEGMHQAEFSHGSFTRTVPLPAEADSDDVTADCDHGILTVSIGLKTAG